MANPMEALRKLQLLEGLDEEELSRFAGKLVRESVPAGTPVLQQGYASDKMYLLLEGRARVLRKMGSSEVLITELDPPQTFGEMGMVDGEPASATVVAGTDLVVLSLRGDDLRELVDSSSALAAKFWRNLSRELTRRIRATTNQVQDYFAINQALCENESFREFYKLYGP